MEHLDLFQRYERPITLPMAGRMGVRSYRMGLLARMALQRSSANKLVRLTTSGIVSVAPMRSFGKSCPQR